MNHPDYSQLKIKPSDLLRHKNRRHSGPTGEACGCCPACGELVVIETIDPGMASTCPHCGSSFGHLIPLGEVGEEGRSYRPDLVVNYARWEVNLIFEKGRIVTVNGRVGVVVLTGSELDGDMVDHTGVWFRTTDDGLPEVITIPTEYLVAGPPPLLKH